MVHTCTVFDVCCSTVVTNSNRHHGTECRKTNMHDIPVSQTVPSNPTAQVHVYLFTRSVHVPPCLQGRLAHSSISGKIVNGNVYLYVNVFYRLLICDYLFLDIDYNLTVTHT